MVENLIKKRLNWSENRVIWKSGLSSESQLHYPHYPPARLDFSASLDVRKFYALDNPKSIKINTRGGKKENFRQITRLHYINKNNSNLLSKIIE